MRKSFLLAISASLIQPACASAQRKLPSIHTDSFSSYETEASYVFKCGETITRLAFTEHKKHDTEGIPLADRWRLELTTLSVESRHISSADLGRLKALFHSLSWLHRIEGNCAGDGDVDITFLAMPAQLWADYAEKRGSKTRPEVIPYGFTISATGAVKFH